MIEFAKYLLRKRETFCNVQSCIFRIKKKHVYSITLIMNAGMGHNSREWSRCLGQQVSFWAPDETARWEFGLELQFGIGREGIDRQRHEKILRWKTSIRLWTEILWNFQRVPLHSGKKEKSFHMFPQRNTQNTSCQWRPLLLIVITFTYLQHYQHQPASLPLPKSTTNSTN